MNSQAMRNLGDSFERLGSSLKPFAIYLAVALAITTVSRMGLSLWQADRVTAVEGWLTIFVQGLRFDLLLQGMLLAFPLSLSPLFSMTGFTLALWRRLLLVLLTLFTIFVAFMELATPSFIYEYDLRPNILFVKYLKFPNEVISMLVTGYKLPMLVAAIVLPILGWFTARLYKKSTRQMRTSPPLLSILAVPVLLFVCAIAVRSSFDHRPANPSSVSFSTDPLVNMLPLPSAYSMLYGAYEMRHEGAGLKYGDIAPEKVIDNMRRMTGLPESAFISEEIPTLHSQPMTVEARERQKNLVILLEESLGARFVGSLGGLPLTPNLDRLSKEGIWFTEMYATGTRSVRGIEAVTTGFLPTTTESVVKLGGTQQGFFTIADLLQRLGYETSFIYGGSAQFDNMRRFFVNNGFQKIIDEENYENPVFAGSWGVSDEDLMAKADAYFDQLPDNQPFFSMVFSTSNHTPFEYPEGRIEPYNEPARTRENAIKYADYAVGKFIEAARASKYWDDTVFVIVADHDSRVKGAELVPVKHFHVPALILGKDISPRTIERVASQVDLIPTLLPLIGIEQPHPATGLDLLNPLSEKIPPHAVMQYGDNIAYRENDDVLIFQPEKPALQFTYEDKALVPADAVDPVMHEMALSHTEWPRLAYLNKWYRLPDEDPKSTSHPDQSNEKEE